jgi:hypothetical protein
VYPQPRIAQLVSEQFRPVRVHVREQRDEYKRLAEKYDARWTPTILIVDPPGTERHRIEGFLRADDFASQLLLLPETVVRAARSSIQTTFSDIGIPQGRDVSRVHLGLGPWIHGRRGAGQSGILAGIGRLPCGPDAIDLRVMHPEYWVGRRG